MNSTMPLNSTDAAILCPLTGRRTSTELYVKLALVHLTTLSSFFHLARRRDGSYLDWGWLFYTLTPLNIVIRHVVGVLGILSFYGCKVLLRKARHGYHESEPLETLRTPLRWLLGRAPEDAYALLPTSDNAADEVQPCDTGGKKIGKTILNGAFLTQCAGAIFLYSRRRQRDAATLADERVFELACGGLVIGLLNTGLSFRLPIFKDRVVDDGDKTMIDRFALFCRDSRSRGLLAFDENSPHWVGLLKNIAISSMAILITHPPWAADAFKYVTDMLFSQSIFGFFIFLLVILPMICGFLYLSFILYEEYRENSTSTTLTRRRYMRWILYPVSTILAAFLTYTTFYVAWALYFSFMYYLLFWAFAIYDIKTLSLSPIDVACPMLWSDPLSEYIWWLA